MTPTALSPFAEYLRAPAPAEDARATLALVEKGLALQATGVAKALAPLKGTAHDRHAWLVAESARRAATLAWALARFPLLDSQVIHLTKRATITIQAGWGQPRPDDPQFTCDVPAFATTYIDTARDPGYVPDISTGRVTMVGGEPQLTAIAPIILGHAEFTWARFVRQFENGTIKLPATGIDLAGRRLVGKAPTYPPQPIIDRVTPLLPHFDRARLLFEAEWQGITDAKDPLIIGELTINGYETLCFVLAAYDQTSLEAYIGREFATGPAAGAP